MSPDSGVERAAFALDERRKKKNEALAAAAAAKATGPHELAHAFVQGAYMHVDGRTLHYWRGEWFEYTRAAWRKVSRDDIRTGIYSFLVMRKLKANKSTVDNVMDALRAVAKLPDGTDAPSWVGKDGADPAHLIPCANGLLNIESGTLSRPTPTYFNLNALSFDFVADAGLPAVWIQFLDQIFESDQEAIETLQEIAGYLLTLDTRQQKAFLLIGPPRSGKGTIARVIKFLVGIENICAPMLANLGAQFGLQEFVGKQLALISDARLSGRADVDAVVENMLRISGEDSVTVPRKFLSDYTGALRVRFLVLTNEVPALADASGALPSRFVILRLKVSFLGREDYTLLDRILPELPGILLWALDGLDRLRKRGHFLQPRSGDSVASDMRDLASPLKVFVREACILDQQAEVEVKALYNAWGEWSKTQGRESSWTVQMFGSRLTSAFPLITRGRGKRDLEGHRERVYLGLRPRVHADPELEGDD
jgi:putative DNA primase/helicase